MKDNELKCLCTLLINNVIVHMNMVGPSIKASGLRLGWVRRSL